MSKGAWNGRADLSRRRASGVSPTSPVSTSPRASRPRSPSARWRWRSTAVADLADPIEKDAKIEFLTRDDPRALELIRHDAAHVMAEAVQSLWPGTQVTIGPVIDNGFFYDFSRNRRSRRKTCR